MTIVQKAFVRKNRKPLVSILINNYNYGLFLAEAIESALAQTYDYCELIIVDDGSVDNSKAVIHKYKSAVTPLFKQNGGQASAINAGFKASKGSIVCLLDADDAFMPHKLERIVQIFQENEEIGWCFHRLKFVDYESKKNLRLSRESISRKCDYRNDIKNGKLNFVPPATSGLCFSRSLLNQILPMPEAESVIISDHYLKVVAVALSKGYFLDEVLTKVNVHQHNRYTENNKNKTLKAKIAVSTAYQMRTRWPETNLLANKLFADGLATTLKHKNDAFEIYPDIKKYFLNAAFKDKLTIIAKVLFKFLTSS